MKFLSTSLILLLLPFFLYCQPLKIQSPIRFLALGDSYTIGQSVAVNQRWPVQLLDSLATRGFVTDTLRILATTGWRTDNLIDALTGQHLSNQQFNLVSVLIGVNNQYQQRPLSQYEQEFPRLLDSAICYAGGDTSHVFVVSIPDYAYTPFGQQSGNAAQISVQLDQYNALALQFAESYGIRFFDITPISRLGIQQPALVAGDGLHPSGLQYSRWVKKILNYVDSTLLTTEMESPTKRRSPALFSNPVGNELFISLGEDFDGLMEMEIRDLAGRVVKTENGTGPEMRSGVAHLTPGMYLARILSGTQLQMVRFVKP